MAYENFMDTPSAHCIADPKSYYYCLPCLLYSGHIHIWDVLKPVKHSPTKMFLHCYSLYLECYLANSLTPLILWFSYQLSEEFPDHLT